MDGTTQLTNQQIGDFGPSWHIRKSGDFNGDGKSDLLWQNDDGTVDMWLMDGTTKLVGQTIGAEGRAGRCAKDVRRHQRIAKQSLKRGAGDRERRAANDRRDDSRPADVQNDRLDRGRPVRRPARKLRRQD